MRLMALALAAGTLLADAATAQDSDERPQGRFLGTFAIGARAVDLLDANPSLIGEPYAALTARELAALDSQVVGRAGTVADGASALILRLAVPPGGRLACAVEGGEADGRCEVLSLGRAAPVGGTTVAAAVYHPPERFGPGADPTPPRYRDAVETREVAVRLTYRLPGAAQRTGTRRFLLARPPLVLVHGTFDSPRVWRSGEPGHSFIEAVEAAGFKAFTVGYGSDGWLAGGGSNQAPFEANRDVVWANPGGIDEAVRFFRRELNLAATRADVVGHSLGGLLARIYASPGYPSADHHYLREANFWRGDINRLVTLCTPHHGSVLPAVLEVFANPDLDRAGILGAALGRMTIGLVRYWKGLDTEGAVRDQMPESEALRRIGATPIPAFAIGCVARIDDTDDIVVDPEGGYAQRIEDLTWLFYLAPGLLEQYLVDADMAREADQLPWVLDAFYERFIARLEEARAGWLSGPRPGGPPARAHQARELQEVFRTLLFQYHDNDFTVGLESQFGGLGADNRRAISGVLHGLAPRYWTVQKRIIDVLKDEAAGPGEGFAQGGFPPAGRPIPPAEPSDTLVALLDGLADEPVGALPDRRSHIAALLDAVHSHAYLRNEEAIRWSGMVYAHALKFMLVAEDEQSVFMFRPVNPDSTALIAADAATKPMNIKAKSSNWGPHRGYLPVDQAFSKKAEASAELIAAFNCDAYDNLAKNAATTVPLTVTVEGESYQLRRTAQSSGDWRRDYICERTAKGKYAPPVDGRFARQLSQRLAIGARQPLLLLGPGADGGQELRGAEDAPAPSPMPSVEETLPFLVFADADGNPMTADYDLLAIGSQQHTCVPGSNMHPQYGAICDWQIPLVEALNEAASTGNCAYDGGDLVHHGPEAQFPGSEFIDYPIIAFIPAWRGDPSRIVAVRQGPEGYRDMHLKRLFTKLRLHGWLIDPNPVAVGWRWGEFDEVSGYDPADQTTFPDDVPDELVPTRPLDTSCDPGIASLSGTGAVQ